MEFLLTPSTEDRDSPSNPGSAEGADPDPPPWGATPPALQEGRSLHFSEPLSWFLGSDNSSLHLPPHAGGSGGSASAL